MATLAKKVKKTVQELTGSDLNVALYVRVSTTKQVKEGYSIEAQLKDLHEYCALNGWTNAVEFIDGGVSGTKLERGAFQELLKRCELGEFNKVVCMKLDRLARNARDFLEVSDKFTKLNVGVVLVKQGFDTSTANGKFALTVFAALAELEASMITERVTEGKEEKASQGGYNGGQSVYGYDFVDGVFIPNDKARIVNQIFDDFVNGKSLNAIAIKLNENGVESPKGSKWRHSTIRYILDNGLYAGIAQYDGQSVENKHYNIITMETHKKAIERLQGLSKGNPNFRKNNN